MTKPTPAQLRRLLAEREMRHASQDTRRDLRAIQLVQPQDAARMLSKLYAQGRK